MDANDADPADEWPLPPSWMWGCTDCIELYKAMKQAPEMVDAAREEGGPGVDYDPMDTVASTQIRLAQHIAALHAAEVPAAHETCERCMFDARSERIPAAIALEHRSRHLFAPPSIAGLL
jgi:hypothetical protein